jgi:hypothetical protein
MSSSRRFLAAAILGLALVASFALAERPGPIDKLAWMAGSWAGETGGVAMEEHWTAPRGGMMLGMHRDVQDGRAVFFEFLRIEARGDDLVYLAQPRGRPETPFTAVEVSESRVVFENKAHDFPQRVLYWTTKDGLLHARVEGPKGGKVVGEEWSWKRVR